MFSSFHSSFAIIDAATFTVGRFLSLLVATASVVIVFKLLVALARGTAVALFTAIALGSIGFWFVSGGGLEFGSRLADQESETIINRPSSGVPVTLPDSEDD